MWKLGLAMGLLLAGCGGVETTPPAEPSVVSGTAQTGGTRDKKGQGEAATPETDRCRPEESPIPCPPGPTGQGDGSGGGHTIQ
jgi:hypothetical protein